MRPHYLTRVVAVLVVILVALVAGVSVSGGDPGTPPWKGSPKGCRPNPMAHVHDPGRLELRDACATFVGRVKKVHFVAAFDDLKITLVPTTDEMRNYLPAANRGVLVADVIATDQAAVSRPPIGSHVEVSGAWVHDKATKTAMMLPTYRIVVNNAGAVTIRGQSTENHGPASPQELQLSLTTARRVVVGGEIHAVIKARWAQFGAVSPASQVRLFTEMTTRDGEGVRWKAVETDTRGIANLRLVAIQVPAFYNLTVYAAPSGQALSVRQVVHVAKR
jgi:hypothetical protein